MRTEWTFHRLNVRTKSELKEYWSKKEARLERLLGRFPDALRDLTLSVSRQTAPDRFSLRAALHLPTRTLVAAVAEHEPNEALDKLCDVLAGEIKRHREQLRHARSYRRHGNGNDQRRASQTAAQQPIPSVVVEMSWEVASGASVVPTA